MLSNEAILYYANHPVEFVQDILKADPDPEQKKILRSLVTNQMTSVRSGHGIGKSAVEAWSVIWFMCTHPYPKIPCTAPTQHQLFDILWAEISKWKRNNKTLDSELIWTKEKLYMKGHAEEWFAVARTASTPDALQGFHAEHMLYIIDEASGVEDKIFEPVLGALSTPGAKLLMCGNPTQLSGFFYDSHNKNREQYSTFHIDGRNSTRVSQEFVQTIINMYGEDSDVFRVRVAGDFPLAEDDIYIPLPLVEKSIATEYFPRRHPQIIHIGCDVARFGTDKTVIGYRTDEKVQFFKKRVGQDTMKTADDIVSLGMLLVYQYGLKPDIDEPIPIKTLFAVVSAAAIIGQVKDFAADSIELGKNYTSVMSEVAAISGASSSDLAMMEDTARQYGATTVFSASEAAEALKYMSLAGWDAQQSTDALGGVLNLAAASSMGLGEASDMVTDYLSAFGMEANKSTYFADMLAYAQSNSNTTAAQLGEAYKNSAANMHAAGQDVETTTSLLEAMANQGRKGSEAGTTLGAMMRDITAKMDDGAIKIGETSIAVQDASGNFRDMTDILTEVGEATEGMGSAQRAAALSSVFTDDSIKGVNMVLAEGMDKVAGYEEALRSATGASEDMAETMNDNLSGDMANMNSAYEEMQLQTFEAMEGPLREGAQWITSDIIPTLTSWVPDAFGTLASGISKVGNALSPMIKTVLQNPKAVASAFASIGAGFAAMKTVNTGIKIAGMVSEAGGMASALGKLGTSLFGSPWAAGAAAAVAAITAVGLAVKKYNDIQVEDSLSAHFGSVELDDSQIEDFASRVIDAQWLVNINAAIGHFENAEEFNQQAEEALAANDALEWKARVGIQLTEDEQSSYMQNIETFKENIEQALTEQTLAAKMTVNEFDIKMADGSSLGSQIEKWAEQDLGEMQSLSAGLTNLVQTALEDGIIDVDEQAAIDQLQGKINNIKGRYHFSGWRSTITDSYR